MLDRLKGFLADEGINCVGCIPFSEVNILSPHLVPDGAKSAILFLIPYDTGRKFSDGVSVYAHVPDYHGYFAGLCERVLQKFHTAFPEAEIFGFADHSPIDEKSAAAKAGLGVIGCNSLLINPVYGSYVFIGSFLINTELPYSVYEIGSCLRCGKCKEGCPGKAISEQGFDTRACLSALSQKKKLSQDETNKLAKCGISWGCDRCQEICPMNKKRRYSPIAFFENNVHGDFTSAEIAAMDDAVFASYAFSWRGRERITQNLQNLEQKNEKTV